MNVISTKSLLKIYQNFVETTSEDNSPQVSYFYGKLLKKIKISKIYRLELIFTFIAFYHLLHGMPDFCMKSMVLSLIKS